MNMSKYEKEIKIFLERLKTNGQTAVDREGYFYLPEVVSMQAVIGVKYGI
jgi:ABC-type phosphate transport system substrate-binding protein